MGWLIRPFILRWSKWSACAIPENKQHLVTIQFWLARKQRPEENREAIFIFKRNQNVSQRERDRGNHFFRCWPHILVEERQKAFQGGQNDCSQHWRCSSDCIFKRDYGRCNTRVLLGIWIQGFWYLTCCMWKRKELYNMYWNQCLFWKLVTSWKFLFLFTSLNSF